MKQLFFKNIEIMEPFCQSCSRWTYGGRTRGATARRTR